MIRKLYYWTLDLAARKSAPHILAAVAFVESSVFPVPPDILLGPMCLAKRHKALYYAGICTIFSVLGGILGYGIGYFFYDAVAAPILGFYGKEESFKNFAHLYNDWGAWIVLGAGITPFPFKVITIASGVTQMNIFSFIFFSLLARSLRFYLIAVLLRRYGVPILVFTEKFLPWIATIGFIIIFVGFLAVKMLF